MAIKEKKTFLKWPMAIKLEGVGKALTFGLKLIPRPKNLEKLPPKSGIKKLNR